MTTQYILQKLNTNKCRRFIANTLGEQGGTTNSLTNAMTWTTEAEAEWFRTKNGLFMFRIVESDGTDDIAKESKIKFYMREKSFR